MKINGELTLSFPEGFLETNEEEKSKLTFYKEGPGTCLQDKERHIILSIGWQKTGRLAGMMLKSKDLARSMEAKVRKPMKAYGYQLEEYPEIYIGGEKADGFRYSYTVRDIEMLGESFVVKKDRLIYTLNFYGRKALREESLGVWRDILNSAEWD